MVRTRVAAIALVVLIPLALSADSVSDIQQQIAALVAQLSSIQQQVGTTAVPPAASSIATQRVCPIIHRTLSRGSRGEDVGGLQQFLYSEGYLEEDSITNYFGALTEEALKAWQSDMDIVSFGTAATTGWGSAGPKTRAAFIRACQSTRTTQSCPSITTPSCAVGTTLVALGNDARGCSLGYQCQQTTATVPQTRLSLTTVSGPSVLRTNQSGTWTILPQMSNGAGDTVNYAAVWGDELTQSDPQILGSIPSGTSFNLIHTYTRPGSFTPVFYAIRGSERAQSNTQVRVDGPNVRALDASPQSGKVPLKVTFAYVGADTEKGQMAVDYGDGNFGTFPSAAGAQISHTYLATGVYNARFLYTKPCNGSSCDYQQSLEKTVPITVTIDESAASYAVNGPVVGAVYASGDNIYVPWTLSGVNGSDAGQFAISIELVPIDSPTQTTRGVGAAIPASPAGEKLGALTGTRKLTAPNGGWWNANDTGGTDSRYVVRSYLGVADSSICSATSTCMPYRIIALKDSATFTVRQARLRVQAITDTTAKTLTASTTVMLPNQCVSAELRWSTVTEFQSIKLSIPPTKTVCTSGDLIRYATSTQTFSFAPATTSNPSVRADLYVNGQFSDTATLAVPYK